MGQLRTEVEDLQRLSKELRRTVQTRAIGDGSVQLSNRLDLANPLVTEDTDSREMPLPEWKLESRKEETGQKGLMDVILIKA